MPIHHPRNADSDSHSRTYRSDDNTDHRSATRLPAVIRVPRKAASHSRRTASHGATLSDHGSEPEVGENGPCLVDHAGSLWSALDLVRAYNEPIFSGPSESDLVGTCLVRALAVLRVVPEAGSQLISSESDSAALAPLPVTLPPSCPDCRVATSNDKRDTDRRRPKGTGSVQELAPGKYRLRVFVGTDPVTGSPRQITPVVQAKTQRQAQKLLDKSREEVTIADPTGSTATVGTLVEE